jgi:hypothetical protein
MAASAEYCQQCGAGTRSCATTVVLVEGEADRVTEFTRRHIIDHPATEIRRPDGTGVVREAFRSFEFASIIPIPACLDGIDASELTIDAMEALTGKSMAQLLLARNPRDVRAFVVLGDQGGFSTEQDLARVAHLQTRLDDLPLEQLEMGLRACTAMAACGYPTLLQWAVANWGTHSRPYDLVVVNEVPGDLLFRFQTVPAWGAPEPVFTELARMYPDLKIMTVFSSGDSELWGKAENGVYITGDVKIEPESTS